MSNNVTRRLVNAGIGASLLTATLAGTRAFGQGINAGATSNQPNIVFILVDNAGWGDLGVYGGMTSTPRIDALANQGIRFNNYNVEPQCTPTRSAILTGRMPIRQGTYTVPLPGQGVYGLSPWEYTLAHLLSDAGYSTALFGKWHCGAAPGRLPTDVGFDEWWGLKNSSDEAGYTTYPLFKESGVEPPMIWEGKKGHQSTPVMPLDMKVRPIIDEKYIIPKTTSFIKAQAQAKKPFFVYVGYSEMHPPMVANPNFAGTSTARGGLYADVIAELDYRVGQVLDAIKDAGIDENTIVVLTSDNTTGGGAAVPGGSNGPWRGNFMTPPFEGSYRTFGMVRWPGHVQAGVVTNEMLSAEDWFATLASMAGAANLIPRDRPIDSIDSSRFLLGQSDTTGRDSFMLFGPDAQLMSIKWKYYKAIFRYAEGIDKPIVQGIFPMVFDLSSDPQETNNLVSSKLDIAWVFAPMFRKIGEYQVSLQKYRNINPGEDFHGYGDTPQK